MVCAVQPDSIRQPRDATALSGQSGSVLVSQSRIVSTPSTFLSISLKWCIICFWNPLMASRVSQDHQGKSKTILVVDDEPATRGLISLILRQGGYAVLEARDCETAVTIHQRHQGQIDLLLTDISLPGPDGV